MAVLLMVIIIFIRLIFRLLLIVISSADKLYSLTKIIIETSIIINKT